MQGKRKRKKWGRPKAEDPCIHLPRVTVRQSTIQQIELIARTTPDESLSRHVERALLAYIREFPAKNI